MFLLALSIAPGLAICLFIYFKDKYNKEPVSYLFKCFFLGMLSAVLSLIVEWGGETMLDKLAINNSIIATLLLAFVVVAFTEEGSKYIMLKNYAFPKPEFDEPFDGIIYSIMVSMGFATLENIFYVFENGVGTAILRMFLSVPAHASFAVLMGYYAGLAKFNPSQKSFYLLKGFLLAVLFHGMFDSFLFLAEDDMATQYISGGLLALGALGSYYFAARLSLKSIRLHQQLSRDNYERQQQDYTRFP